MTNTRETTLNYISPTQNTHTRKSKFQENDTEISIFDAHKYFNDIKTSPDSLSDPRFSSVDGYCKNFWTKSFRSTPTPSSEISFNSQTGLLPNPENPARIPNKNCINKRWYAAKKWLLRRKCCCRGEKSVKVNVPLSTKNTISVCQEKKQSKAETECCSIDEKIVEIHHIKAAPDLSEMDFTPFDGPRQRRIKASGRSFIDGAVGFTFPILNPLLEGFQKQGCSVLESNGDDDAMSDASSDLFEIEGLTMQTVSYPAAEEVGGGNGLCLKSYRKEKAEGPSMLPLHVGGRSLPPQYGSFHSAAGRLSVAFVACEVGVSQASWW